MHNVYEQMQDLLDAATRAANAERDGYSAAAFLERVQALHADFLRETVQVRT